jgi:predicted adenylyl cyclase CyaB
MPRNVEVKAYIESVDLLARKIAAIADKGPIEIDQDDTFFYCDAGKLKLRALSPEEGELIFYRRADQHGPKESYYLRSLTSTPETLRELLTQAYGEAARVKKHRTLFLVGRTRLHLDTVKFLGHFLEIEVVLKESEPVEIGIGEARSVMATLGIDPSQLIAGSYVDLLAQQGACNQFAAGDPEGPGN